MKINFDVDAIRREMEVDEELFHKQESGGFDYDLEWLAEITKAERKATKTGGEMIELTWRIIGKGAMHDREIPMRLHIVNRSVDAVRFARRQLRMIAKRNHAEYSENPADLVGLKAYVRLRYDDEYWGLPVPEAGYVLEYYLPREDDWDDEEDDAFETSDTPCPKVT